MDKIEALGEGFSLRKRTKKGSRKKKADFSFTSYISEAAKEESISGNTEYHFSSENLEEALDEIYSQGDALVKASTMENVRRYKSAVTAFLQYIMAHILKIEEKTSGVNPLKRKRYVLIHIVNKKLEQLAVDVLKGQGEQLNILERVDEINGLLVNLVT